MKWLTAFFTTSIGKKQIMAVTGLFLTVFLIVHLSGNFILFVGAEAFNKYASFYSDHPKLLLVAEAGLITLFLLHIIMALKLTMENRAARPQAYEMKNPSDATLASRTMIYTGIITFVFLVWHLIAFKFGPHHTHAEGLYGVVVDAFQVPYIGGLSILAMLLLGFHLNHGIRSVVQTFGLEHAKYTPLVKLIGLLVSLFIGIGFAIIPLYFLVMKG